MTPIQRAWRAVGGLSSPSKMPGYAWGISAKRCITGAKLAKVPGTVCNSCYALKGHYLYPVVHKAHERRLRAFDRSPNRWTTNMATLINRLESGGHFRWFDSGDLQSRNMLWHITQVCRTTENTKHWLSTREYGILSDYFDWCQKIHVTDPVPDNLTIRLAAHKIDSFIFPKKYVDGITYCRVVDELRHERHENERACPAHKQNNQCGKCRSCWDRNVSVVSYPIH